LSSFFCLARTNKNPLCLYIIVRLVRLKRINFTFSISKLDQSKSTKIQYLEDRMDILSFELIQVILMNSYELLNYSYNIFSTRKEQFY